MFKAVDKTQLKPGERAELARMLRQPGIRPTSDLPPLAVFRHAIDDLRLFRALEAAGLLGRVVVADRLEDAAVVLASRRKRTGKDVSLVEVRRAADNTGLPYFELAAVSPLKVAQALAPLLGMQVPQHLLQQQQAAVARHLPHLLSRQALHLDAETGTQRMGSGGDVPSSASSSSSPSSQHLTAQGIRQTQAPASSTSGALAARSAPIAPAAYRNVVAPADLLDGIDALEDRQALLPHNPCDRLGTRHVLRRQGTPNSNPRRRKLLQQLEQERASW